jgi:6-phosphogluconate dehydrogenase
MELQVPIPVIDTAVTSRYYSAARPARLAIAKNYEQGETKPLDSKQKFISKVEDALYFAMIITYTQGLELLAEASKKQGYDLNIEDIARIWRGGCIIRSSFLENIARAYESKDITTLLSDKETIVLLKDNAPGIRDVICHAVNVGIPVPALSASLAYFDSYRNGWLPANLIQAQRDYFGAHTYERLDKEGTFHSIWHSKK